MTTQRETRICNTCSSEDVVKDAWAVWNKDKQEWVLDCIFDNEFCKNCEGETTVIDGIEITPP